MSRIDEALERARTARPDQLAPPPDGVQSLTADLAFPVEAEEPPVTAIVDTPAFDEQESIQLAPPAPSIEVESDLSTFARAEKLVYNSAERVPVEQYRRLAARLLAVQVEKGTRLVMVTSAFPQEGKTLTSANLAITLSESYKRKVLLIDGDLRRPSVHEVFHIPNATGLNDGLQSGAERKIPLLQYTENLSILTAGRPDSDPMSVLSSERMSQVLDEARSRFDWIIVDTPPVALLPDAHLLAGRVDAVLLVIEAGQTPLPALQTAVQVVGRERILGVVLNKANAAMAGAAYDYYGNYGGERV
jgi:capsular exopolysaccharide synthesis family protein